jgi:hypothetical protein
MLSDSACHGNVVSHFNTSLLCSVFQFIKYVPLRKNLYENEISFVTNSNRILSQTSELTFISVPVQPNGLSIMFPHYTTIAYIQSSPFLVLFVLTVSLSHRDRIIICRYSASYAITCQSGLLPRQSKRSMTI